MRGVENGNTMRRKGGMKWRLKKERWDANLVTKQSRDIVKLYLCGVLTPASTVRT